MAVGFKSTVADLINNALLKHGTAYQGPTALFVQLHRSDPGAAGLIAVADSGHRVAVTFTSSSGGVAANTADVLFSNVTTNETYNFFSVWDASSGGNFLFSGTLTANPVQSGNDFTISSGQLVATLLVAA